MSYALFSGLIEQIENNTHILINYLLKKEKTHESELVIKVIFNVEVDIKINDAIKSSQQLLIKRMKGTLELSEEDKKSIEIIITMPNKDNSINVLLMVADENKKQVLKDAIDEVYVDKNITFFDQGNYEEFNYTLIDEEHPNYDAQKIFNNSVIVLRKTDFDMLLRDERYIKTIMVLQ